MESQKFINLLEEPGDDELYFQTKRWYIINGQNNGQMEQEIKTTAQLNLIQK